MHTNQITAIDIEVECSGVQGDNMEYSIITLADKQPINIGKQNDPDIMTCDILCLVKMPNF